MPDIRVNINVTGPDIAGDLIAAILRELRVSMVELGHAAVKYWRGVTPVLSGDLRRSLHVQASVRDRSVQLRFQVRPPGSRYYRRVARLNRYRHLRNNLPVIKYIDANLDAYVDQAIGRALA